MGHLLGAAAALVLATGADGHGSLRPSFGTFAQPPPATDRPRRCFQNAGMSTTHAGMSPGDKQAGFEGASKAIEVYLLVIWGSPTRLYLAGAAAPR
jgi:hypothetical protein